MQYNGQYRRFPIFRRGFDSHHLLQINTSMGEELVKNNKIMTALEAPTIREIVDASNELGIKREDIVSILPTNGRYIMVYYYEG